MEVTRGITMLSCDMMHFIRANSNAFFDWSRTCHSQGEQNSLTLWRNNHLNFRLARDQVVRLENGA